MQVPQFHPQKNDYKNTWVRHPRYGCFQKWGNTPKWMVCNLQHLIFYWMIWRENPLFSDNIHIPNFHSSFTTPQPMRWLFLSLGFPTSRFSARWAGMPIAGGFHIFRVLKNVRDFFQGMEVPDPLFSCNSIIY